MYSIRPGAKLPRGQQSFKNRPEAIPPVLLRHLIAFYAIVLGTTTVLGIGFPGKLPVSDLTRIALSISAVLMIGAWLFGSSKMRLYYALVNGKPIPDDLAPKLRILLTPSAFVRRTASVMDWATDYLETIVLLGFLALALYTWYRTSV